MNGAVEVRLEVVDVASKKVSQKIGAGAGRGEGVRGGAEERGGEEERKEGSVLCLGLFCWLEVEDSWS